MRKAISDKATKNQRTDKTGNVISMQAFRATREPGAAMSEYQKDIIAGAVFRKLNPLRKSTVISREVTDIMEMVFIVLTEGDVGEIAYLNASTRTIYEIVKQRTSGRKGQS